MELLGAVLIWLVAIALGLGFLACILFIGLAPGHIAKDRGHPSWEAIRLCGLIGLFIWPCWLIALIWAYTGKANPPPLEPDYHLGESHGIAPRITHRLPTTEEARALKIKSRRERAAEKERGSR